MEEGDDPLPPLKRLRSPDREEDAERFLYGRPARGGPEAEGFTSGEEEEVRDFPLPNKRDTARLDDISEERWTWATTSLRISSLNRPVPELGATVRDRR